MTDSIRERPTLLLTLFLRAAHAIVQELVCRLAAAGYPDIRPADSRVFENLDPDGTRVTELAARAQMTHQSMGELISGLEVRGYLERLPDPRDRRARLVQLTPRGRALLRIAVVELAAIESAWFPPTGPCEAPRMRVALEQAVAQDPRPSSDSVIDAEGSSAGRRRGRTTATNGLPPRRLPVARPVTGRGRV